MLYLWLCLKDEWELTHQSNHFHKLHDSEVFDTLKFQLDLCLVKVYMEENVHLDPVS